MRDAQDKVRSIQAKLLAAQNHLKEYADRKVRYMTLEAGPVEYRLVLPHSLSGVHPVVFLSMLKKYHGDGDYIIKWGSVLLDKELQYKEETITILDRDVWKLRTKEINMVKVQWKHCSLEEAIRETEKDRREKYAQLLDELGTTLSLL
ncbi:uncharacterized protein LOC129872286 [Solanum dulcamara]|uniref:uncharacterized protein LOC129872286 n=1 Tax=Solanum dulcamara TaxID=45834 RepID=UPI002485A173|nr:uncharacterized protein LOC129872286 [Solanum dulcamara]